MAEMVSGAISPKPNYPHSGVMILTPTCSWATHRTETYRPPVHHSWHPFQLLKFGSSAPAAFCSTHLSPWGYKALLLQSPLQPRMTSFNPFENSVCLSARSVLYLEPKTLLKQYIVSLPFLFLHIAMIRRTYQSLFSA